MGPFRAVSVAIVSLSSLLVVRSELPGQVAVRLPPATASERWVERVPVGGGLRVGFMVAVEGGRLDPTTFRVLLPESPDGRLCVEVNSRDGRYEGKYEYDLTGMPAALSARLPGALALELRTSHGRELARYPPEQLAILARLSEDCVRELGTFVAASWAEPPLPAEFVVLLNSRVPTFIVVGASGRVVREERCTELPDGGTTYNLRCVLQTSWIDDDVTIFVRQRERIGPTTRSNDSPLPILLVPGR